MSWLFWPRLSCHSLSHSLKHTAREQTGPECWPTVTSTLLTFIPPSHWLHVAGSRRRNAPPPQLLLLRVSQRASHTEGKPFQFYLLSLSQEVSLTHSVSFRRGDSSLGHTERCFRLSQSDVLKGMQRKLWQQNSKPQTSSLSSVRVSRE